MVKLVPGRLGGDCDIAKGGGEHVAGDDVVGKDGLQCLDVSILQDRAYGLASLFRRQEDGEVPTASGKSSESENIPPYSVPQSKVYGLSMCLPPKDSSERIKYVHVSRSLP